MKRVLGYIFFNIAVLSFSIEFNTYDMEVEHVFKASQSGSKSVNDLAIDNFSGPGASGPSIYYINNKLVIADQVNKNRRTIELNKDYSFKNIFKTSFYNDNILINKNIIIGYNPSYIKSYDLINNWKEQFLISTFDFVFFREYKDVYYQDNTLFIFDKDYKLWAIKNPGLDDDKNRNNIIKEDQIILEIQDGKYKGLTIDSEKRLFLNGELQTVNFSTFYNFHKELNKRNNETQPKLNFTLTVEDIRTGSEKLIGKDIDGNTYWSSWNTDIAIFNNKGFMIDLFVTERSESSTTPAVSPEGDVYFMKYGEDKVTLYKVKRQW